MTPKHTDIHERIDRLYDKICDLKVEMMKLQNSVKLSDAINEMWMQMYKEKSRPSTLLSDLGLSSSDILGLDKCGKKHSLLKKKS